MTPQKMAEIHASAFVQGRPWTTDEFRALLESPFVEAFHNPQGFALVRTVAGEAELLTIAVTPEAQGRGVGRSLLNSWLDTTDADEAFLEVAEDNLAAIALYRACRFAEITRRKAYYVRPAASAQDAIVMRRALP